MKVKKILKKEGDTSWSKNFGGYWNKQSFNTFSLCIDVSFKYGKYFKDLKKKKTFASTQEGDPIILNSGIW